MLHGVPTHLVAAWGTNPSVGYQPIWLLQGLGSHFTCNTERHWVSPQMLITRITRILDEKMTMIAWQEQSTCFYSCKKSSNARLKRFWCCKQWTVVRWLGRRSPHLDVYQNTSSVSRIHSVCQPYIGSCRNGYLGMGGAIGMLSPVQGG